MSLTSILNIGNSALMATQSALNTTSNNIANSSTPGYACEDVVLAGLPSGATGSAGSSGNGVTVADVQRLYNSFNTQQLNNAESSSSYWSTYSSYAGSLENIFNEASTSATGTIGDAITGFSSALQQVAQDPGDTASRTSLIDAGQTLASSISGAANALTSQQTQIYQNSQSLVTQVNSLTSQIASLNQQIVATPGALDMQDQRDSLITQLSQLTNVSTIHNSNGSLNIYLGGTALVDAAGSYDMSVKLAPNTNDMQFSVGTGTNAITVNSDMTGGQLGANLDAANTTIQGYLSKLNTFATEFSTAINTQQDKGYDLNGKQGTDFFFATSAQDMQVKITDPNLIAASATAAGVPGDGSNATAIGNIANTNIISGNSSTPTDYYSAIVAEAGNDAQSANTNNTSQSALVTQLQTQQQSVSGVSLDQQAVNLTQYENSYEAAGKLISTISTLFNTLIAMVQ
jgi:flagellar hook-associated protein 1 FlgK